ncbi:hypothetical protein FRC08_001828 [Ceratobasidium sp. 394]|nr:hypothetical protein FRC08_001828 [Ceratobasidium sp. 394]
MDLDNRAFTINGLMHFRLDNMPPGSLDSYFWVTPDPEDPTENHLQAYAHPPRTPVEYIATVSRWPPPDFDIVWVREEYAKLAPLILPASDWGAPTWTSLTVSQQLSASLVQTILLDNPEILSNPDAIPIRDSFNVCCWQLLSAAAPSHLRCPVDPPPSNSARHFHTVPIKDLGRAPKHWNCVTPHYFTLLTRRETWGITRNYYWFRGCLVAFRPRLDQVEYVEYETVQIVHQLRKFGRTNGIGLVFSGRHILAVAVDGDTVRCSHPLLFHDVKMKSQDGFLLATHLLCPMLAVDKTPWIQTLSPKPIASALIRLPHELIRQIIFLLDHDSYQNLEHVSRPPREMHTAYPRVGNYVLLRHIDDYTYCVHHTETGTETIAYLQRSAPFCSSYMTLVYSFQRVSLGPHNLYPGSDYCEGMIHGAESNVRALLGYRVEWKGDCWPTIYMQAVHGIWRFVDLAVATSNFPEEVEYD